MLPNGDITKCQSAKNGKIWGFPPLQCDRINWSRWNLALKHRQWVYASISNLALISKGYRSPKMSTWAQNCSFSFTESDTINRFKLNLACKDRPCVYHLLPNLARNGKWVWVQELPKVWKFGQNCKISAFCPASVTQYTNPDDIKPVSIDLAWIYNLHIFRIHITYIFVNDWFPAFFTLFLPLFFLDSFISLVIDHYYTSFCCLAFCCLQGLQQLFYTLDAIPDASQQFLQV